MTTVDPNPNLYTYAEKEYSEYLSGDYNHEAFLEFQNWLKTNDPSYNYNLNVFLQNHVSPFSIEYYLIKNPPYTIVTNDSTNITNFCVKNTTSKSANNSSFIQDSSCCLYFGFEVSVTSGSSGTIELTFDNSILDATFICVGGGGGGAGGGGGNYNSGGSGGGGGGLSIISIDLSSNFTYSMTVGSGGEGGIANANGNNGNKSIIQYEYNDDNYIICSCTAGGGGVYIDNMSNYINGQQSVVGIGGYCNTLLNNSTNNTFGFGGMGGLGGIYESGGGGGGYGYIYEYGSTGQGIYGTYFVGQFYFNSNASNSCTTNGMIALPIPIELTKASNPTVTPCIPKNFSGGGIGGNNGINESGNTGYGSGGKGGKPNMGGSNGENGIIYCYFTYPQTRSEYESLTKAYEKWFAPINFAWTNLMEVYYLWKRFFYICYTKNYDIADTLNNIGNIDYSGNYIAFKTSGAYLEQQLSQFEYEFVNYLNSLLENDTYLKERINYWKYYDESYYDVCGELLTMDIYNTSYYHKIYTVEQYYKNVFAYISKIVKGDINTFLQQNFSYYGDVKKTIQQNSNHS
jgi:hypothetical protein